MLDKLRRARFAPTSAAQSEDARATLALRAARFAEYEWDLARDTLFVSEELARITGGRAGESPARLGEALLDPVHEQDRAGLRNLVHSARAGGADGEERSENRYRVVTPSGEVRWVLDTALLVRGPSPGSSGRCATSPRARRKTTSGKRWSPSWITA